MAVLEELRLRLANKGKVSLRELAFEWLPRFEAECVPCRIDYIDLVGQPAPSRQEALGLLYEKGEGENGAAAS